MGRTRTAEEQQVAELLRTAKEALGLSIAFLSRMDGETQHLEVVDTTIPYIFQEKRKVRQSTSLCQAIQDGKLPPVVPDLRQHPVAMALPATRFPRLRSYVSVPVTLSDGSFYGTFCAAGLTTDKGLSTRDKALLEVLASATAVIIEPGIRAAELRTEVEGRLAPLMAAGGPTVVLQPIVDLATGYRVGAEALSRFPADWAKAPDVVFAEAHGVGLGDELELLALERAVEHLARVPGYVAMNISPQTLLTPGAADLLRRVRGPRVLLELSEHDPVEDYDALHAALEDARGAGMRLAIDDVGAGFSSLRHIVLCRPDVIKLDRSIVDGLSADPVLSTLVGALVEFARGSSAKVVAEGVETLADVDALRALGVGLGQGWYFGRPGPPEALTPLAPAAAGTIPQPSRPVDDAAAAPARGPVDTRPLTQAG